MLAVRQLVRQQVHSVSGDKNLAQSHFYFREEKLGQKLEVSKYLLKFSRKFYFASYFSKNK